MSRATMPRRRGRPRNADNVTIRTRNCWFSFLHHYGGLTIAEIAREEGYHPDTVRSGIAEARTYVRDLRCREDSPESGD